MGERRLKLTTKTIGILGILLLAMPLQSCIEGGGAGLFTCGTECLFVSYTECTCDPSDPCGWTADGFCDVSYCAAAIGTYFDDSSDCGSSAGCEGTCGRGEYNNCTCDSDDPCGWVGDGTCDTDSCSGVTDTPFDDTNDCTGGGSSCDGDCSGLRYTACTCGSSDPCGWRGDGDCDEDACSQFGSDYFDDSADCGGVTVPTGDNSYGVTAVRDDLDNTDLEIMATGLQNLGYAAAVRDTNVSSSSFRSYAGQNLTVFYHTGHGLDGAVQTSDGLLTVTSLNINSECIIFATCLTLVPNLSSAFGSTAQAILGYTMVSFDSIDEDVANGFLTGLGAGQSYIAAWYQANNADSNVRDRWAGYVREGGSVVEYSARSSSIPSVEFGNSFHEMEQVQLGRSGNLSIAQLVLDDDRVFADSYSAVAVRENSDLYSAFLPGDWDLLGPNRMSREEAVELAEAFVDARLGGLPSDAILDPVISVISTQEDGSESTVGHTVQWSRELDNLPIRGNRVTDHISVLVGAEGVAAWSQYWPELELIPATMSYSDQLLSVGDAVLLAADEIDRSAKGPLFIISARLVHGTLGPNGRQPVLVPAYELLSVDGARVVVDAMTGHPLP